MSETDSVLASANSARTWSANPTAALLVRLAMFLLPLTAGLLAFWLVPAGALLSLLGALVAAATTDRLSRQLGPLSTLYELSLVFPSHAPSRWAIAQRIRSAGLEQELLEISTGEDFEPEEPQAAAERSLVLVGLLDRHDRLTGGHSARVSRYADLTAQAMGLSSADRAMLTWAALLHDVGKLKISAEILAGKDELTELERATLEQHPGTSADLMRSLFEWLGDAFGAATEHHERWDGTGYPLQLAREEISMAGRITAVADAFDAMTASNSYRKSVSVGDARSELMACSGSQFDPAVVRAFVNLSLDKQWARPVSWIFDTPGLATNALGLAPLAIATLLLGVGAAVSGLSASSPDLASGTDGPPPSQLAAIVDTSEGQPTSTTAPTETTEATQTTEKGVGSPEPDTTTSTAAGPDTSAVNYPSASDDDYSSGTTDWVLMDVLANDDSGDFDWDFATLDFYVEPDNGDEWEALSDGTLRYRPLASFAGPDTFSYVVCNTGGHCAIGTVTVTVQEN